MSDAFDDKPSLLDAFGKPDEDDERPASSVPAIIAPTAEAMFGAPRSAIKVQVKRDVRDVLTQIGRMAAAAGDDWYYRWPVNRKDRKTGKVTVEYIEGPSIKLANEIARQFGNCETDVRVFDAVDSWLFYARFTDFETGSTLVRPFQQRKGQRVFGERASLEDKDRALDIAFQIGASKAIRNVICNALQSVADYAFEEAKGAIVKKIGKDLEHYRTEVVRKLTPRVDINRVEAVVGRPAKEWLAPDVALVIASMKSVQDGMASMDETFPPLGKPAEEEASKLDGFGSGADAKTPQASGVGVEGGAKSSNESPPSADKRR